MSRKLAPSGIVTVIVVPVVTPSVRTPSAVNPAVAGLSAFTVTVSAAAVEPLRVNLTVLLVRVFSVVAVGAETVSVSGAAIAVDVTVIAPVRSTMSEF